MRHRLVRTGETGGAAKIWRCVANRLEEAKVQRYLLYRGFFGKKFSQFTVILRNERTRGLLPSEENLSYPHFCS